MPLFKYHSKSGSALLRNKDQADFRVNTADDLAQLNAVHGWKRILRDHQLICIRIFLDPVNQCRRMCIQIYCFLLFG